MKRTLSVLFIVATALLSVMGTASAGSDVVAKPVTVTAPRVAAQSGASVQALSCSSGDLCAWPVSSGSSSRCSWSNADNDWQASPVTCSWSSSRAVTAVYNHGTSTSYVGVCLYPAANYSGNVGYLVYRGQQASGFPGVKIRSHKWVTAESCF
jgi:hypothetical protein